MNKHRPTFRRPKECPSENAWHTLRVGMVIFAILLLMLPLIFEALG